MKKKFLFLSALVAATTAFVSCSSDENLAEVPDVVEETPAKTGTPFSVVVANDDGTTRATLIDNTSLGSFKLFAKQGSAAPWINGNVFKFEDSKWNPYQGSTAVEMSWPTEDKETASNFYAYSDNSTDGVTVDTGSPTTSCVVTDNLANGSFVYKFYTDPNDHVWNKTGRGGYNFTVSNVVDLDKQSDLLVAYTTQNEAAGTSVPLHFRHALASLAIQARFTCMEWNATEGASKTTGINEGARLTIMGIRIYGLKGGGTFTFPATDDYNAETHRWGTTPWTTEGGTDVIYEKNFDTPKVISAQNQTSATDPINKTEIIGHTDLMVIPQSYTPWPWTQSKDTGVAPSNCYVAIRMSGVQGDGEGGDGSQLTEQVYYLPLTTPSTSNAFLAGVKHTITLNLNYVCSSTGTYVFSPSGSGGIQSAPMY